MADDLVKQLRDRRLVAQDLEDRAADEIERLREALKMANRSYARLEEREGKLLEAAEAREAALREALRKHALHSMGCPLRPNAKIAPHHWENDPSKCTCGLSKALANTKEQSNG